MRDSCVEAYIVNLDEKLVAQRAGSSIEDYKHHNPTWIDEPAPNVLLEEHCPYLMEELNKVQVLIDNPDLTNNEKDDLCLDTALGVLLFVKHCL